MVKMILCGLQRSRSIFSLQKRFLILILRRLWQLLMKSWSMDLVCSIIPDRNSWTGVLYRKCAGFRQNRLPEQILEKQQVIKTDRNLFDINVGSCLFIL